MSSMVKFKLYQILIIEIIEWPNKSFQEAWTRTPFTFLSAFVSSSSSCSPAVLLCLCVRRICFSINIKKIEWNSYNFNFPYKKNSRSINNRLSSIHIPIKWNKCSKLILYCLFHLYLFRGNVLIYLPETKLNFKFNCGRYFIVRPIQEWRQSKLVLFEKSIYSESISPLYLFSQTAREVGSSFPIRDFQSGLVAYIVFTI